MLDLFYSQLEVIQVSLGHNRSYGLVPWSCFKTNAGHVVGKGTPVREVTVREFGPDLTRVIPAGAYNNLGTVLGSIERLVTQDGSR